MGVLNLNPHWVNTPPHLPPLMRPFAPSHPLNCKPTRPGLVTFADYEASRLMAGGDITAADVCFLLPVRVRGCQGEGAYTLFGEGLGLKRSCESCQLLFPGTTVATQHSTPVTNPKPPSKNTRGRFLRYWSRSPESTLAHTGKPDVLVVGGVGCNARPQEVTGRVPQGWRGWKRRREAGAGGCRFWRVCLTSPVCVC